MRNSSDTCASMSMKFRLLFKRRSLTCSSTENPVLGDERESHHRRCGFDVVPSPLPSFPKAVPPYISQIRVSRWESNRVGPATLCGVVVAVMGGVTCEAEEAQEPVASAPRTAAEEEDDPGIPRNSGSSGSLAARRASMRRERAVRERAVSAVSNEKETLRVVAVVEERRGPSVVLVVGRGLDDEEVASGVALLVGTRGGTSASCLGDGDALWRSFDGVFSREPREA